MQRFKYLKFPRSSASIKLLRFIFYGVYSLRTIIPGYVAKWYVLVLFILIFGISKQGQSQEYEDWPLWRSLKQGKYAIGFKLVNATVAGAGTDNRIIRLALWYPVKPGSIQDTMIFKNYLDVIPDTILDPSFETWMSQRDQESLSRQFFDDQAESRQAALMTAPIPIQVNAPNADGKFPLVIHSLGRNGNQFQHTILWEFLASHGYAVVSVGQYGKNKRNPTMAFSFKDLSIQLKDMEHSISWLDQLSYIDTKRIGLLGHSSGAIISLWLASTDPRIYAVVGLDGSMNRPENQRVFRKGISNKNLVVPILNICRWPHPEYYDEWTKQFQGNISRVGYERGIHFDFQNWPAYQAFAGGQEPTSMKIRSLDEAETLFVSTARIAKLFMDANLKLDPDAQRAIHNPKVIEVLSNKQATLTISRVVDQ